MKRLLALASIIIIGHSAWAQFDVFGNRVPKSGRHVEKSVNLPDKPNEVDENGVRQGEWARKYANGHYAYTATFKDGKPIGEMVRYDEKGNKTAVLNYINESDTCTAVLYGANEKIEAKGSYVGKTRHGKWSFFGTDGKLISEEVYTDGMLNGNQCYYHNNGQLSQVITYNMGYAQGKSYEYFSSGRVQTECNYERGRLNGHYKVIDELSGEVAAEGEYEKGVRKGKWRMYDSFAKEYYTVEYDAVGNAKNQDEIDRRKERKMQYFEKNKSRLQDPELFKEDPMDYRP
ncbi:MAG: hypothetical protein Q4C30_05545 [Bacteroidia bacterium]|nr:hypothetical protein [Bacteroidia bacterium]